MPTPREVLRAIADYKLFLEYFKPYKDDGESAYYENSNENREFIKKLNETSPNNIWSVSNESDGNTILSGFWEHDDVFAWYVTQRTWMGEPAGRSFMLDMYVPCKKCDSQGTMKRGGECSECKGDGYKVYYID
jgi:hypothetical protein